MSSPSGLSDDEVWANYDGGAIRRGFFVGLRSGETLSFRYCRLNQNGETSTGRCVSQITRTGDGRLRLSETWAWESQKGSGVGVVEGIGEPPLA